MDVLVAAKKYKIEKKFSYYFSNEINKIKQ